MPIPFYRPDPAPHGVLEKAVLPRDTANPLSWFFFQWITPIMKIGYSRPLETGDLWQLPKDIECKAIADDLEKHLMARMPPSRRTQTYTTSKILEQPSGYTLNETQTSNEVKANGSTVDRSGVNAAADAELLTAGPGEGALRDDDDHSVINRALSRQTAHSALEPVKNGQPKPEDIEKYGKRKATKIAKGKIAYEDGQAYDLSLWKAILKTIWKDWIASMLFVLTGYILRVTAPQVTRLMINQLTLAYNYRQAQQSGSSTADLQRPRSIGYGIGLAFAMFIMQFAGVMFVSHARLWGAIGGCKGRGAVIDLISRKSMRLSTRARSQISNGRINTMVSADSSYVDRAVPESAELPVTPIIILIGIGQLIWLMGYSALVGIGVLVLLTPLQGWMFGKQLVYRRAQAEHVDERVRLLTEVIGSIRAVKLYSYEEHFVEKIREIREREHNQLRSVAWFRSTVRAVLQLTPLIATMLTFVTYALSGHDLDPGTIFAALQIFNVIRFPIARLPILMSAVIDAISGIERIRAMLQAEELKEHINIDLTAQHSVDVRGDFKYDRVIGHDAEDYEGGQDKGDATYKEKWYKRFKKASQEKGKAGPESQDGDLENEKHESSQTPFCLRNVSLQIPQGALVCIVGRVGTGKTSLLSGMINEMKQTRGHVRFGGNISYVPQQAWVLSGSIRDNIIFGSDAASIDLNRVNSVIEACGLTPDLDMWEDGDLTRIGEKGITLSGGQRQRICIARAAYEDSAIVLLDDPLSAVDAHVGAHLLDNCILNGPFAHRTRILVTHHLDILPKADLILVMDRDDNNIGRIVQQGTYEDLRGQDGIFRNLIAEYGSAAHHDPNGSASSGSTDSESEDEDKPVAKLADEDKAKGGKLLLDEERIIGAVPWSTYVAYWASVRSWTMVFLILASSALDQASQVANSLVLGFWSGRTLDGFATGHYMALYSGLGGMVCFLQWFAIAFTFLAGIRASFVMFNDAAKHVFRSPTTWHDRTPSGRIISRLSKDIQALDDFLPIWWNIFFSESLAFVGTLFLVIFTFPWLGFLFLGIIIYCSFALLFYRRTSREIKRLDSLLRSHIYGSFAEQLAGLPVIRAFNQQQVFQRRLQVQIDDQNRAYTLSLTAQRWLSVRLDFFSLLIVLLIGVFGAVFRDDIDPSRLGVVLTYAVATAQTVSGLVITYAQVEQEMNNVERIEHYRHLEMEAEPQLATDPPESEWPSRGAIRFDNVELRYRSDLPKVLKGISFDIKPGEKVGIIGRTGSGKSTTAQALFRTVEPCGGQILVDGVDLQSLGISTVRSRLAIIPQDAFLFAGNVRDNIDPLETRTDAELNDALNLIQSSASASHSLREKFKLDAPVLAEGTNFSAGEKQLLALMRALVRGCKVLLLDEATSSVDPETDALIQKIIQTEFADVTLISIAHRLQTVAYYDRILVLDAGQVAENDTPLALYDNPKSIFRSLCDKKDLHRQDLLRIQADAAAAM